MPSTNLPGAETPHPKMPTPDARPRLEMRFGFGGAKARYKSHPGRVIRCVDPFCGIIEAFKSPLQYENWLLRRFDPQLVYLNTSGDEWAILSSGTHVRVKPDLVWAPLSTRGTLEIVVEPGRSVSEQQLTEFTAVATAHRMATSIRQADTIRECPRQLEFLDRIRQVMAIHYTDLREQAWTERIDRCVQDRRQITRGDLISHLTQAFAGCTEQLVDAGLFWLRQFRHIDFAIEGGGYGNATVISR